MPGLGWHQNAGLPITHVRSDARPLNIAKLILLAEDLAKASSDGHDKWEKVELPPLKRAA